MKFVFVDKNDKEVEIITDILSSWNVKYNVIQRKVPFGFSCYFLNDIEIDVEYAFYEYLLKEINAKLNVLEILEDSYNLPDFENTEVNKRNSKKSKRLKNKKSDLNNDNLSAVMTIEPSEAHGLIKFFKQLTSKNSVKRVNWEHLPEEVKQELLTQAPESVLRSKDTTIIETQNGYIINFYRAE